MNIFPKLKKEKWVKLNLNSESKKYPKVDFNDYNQCKKWIELLHKKNKTDYSYGGLFEDRSNIWKGSYLQPTNSFIHLGIDYNVPIGTSVALPVNAKVENIVIDPNQNGGWGAGVKFKIEGTKHYMIYAHLTHKLKLKIGDNISSGEIVAKTGKMTENGGWYPHLHLQIFTNKFDDLYMNDIDRMDGYLPKGHPHLKYIVDPMKYVKLKD